MRLTRPTGLTGLTGLTGRNGLSMQAWITTAYLITATLVTPIYGKLSDQPDRPDT